MDDPVTPKNVQVDVAISCAGGEYLPFVREVADLLQQELGKQKVFFYESWYDEVDGLDGHLVLQKFFKPSVARLVVVFFCQRYNQTDWTREEWRAIQASERHWRDASGDNAKRLRLLLYKFEDVAMEGIESTAIVPAVNDKTSAQIAQRILSRLNRIKEKGAAPEFDEPTEPASPLTQLIEYAQRGQLVVMLDDVLDPEAGVSKSALAAALTREAGLPAADLFVAGSILEARMGRKELHERVMQQLRADAGASTAPYQALARLPITTVVSMFPDLVLEKTLAQAAEPYRGWVADEAMAVHQLGPGSRDLFLIGGSGHFSTGLMLTRTDYDRVVTHVAYLRRGLRLGRRAVLLLGCDLADEQFRKLFFWISRHRTLHDGPLFITGVSSADPFWQRWNPGFINLTSAELLRTLERAVAGVRVCASPPRPVPKAVLTRPYRYLDYFTRDDAALFFGREAATPALADEILSSNRRITVLCGRSGAGKTSLIQAGLLPFLDREHGFRTVYTRCGDDPVESICRAIDSEGRVPADAPAEFLAEVPRREYENDRRLQIVCIDQFEEAFIRLGASVLETFAASLEACLRDPQSVTRVLIVIRADYLSRLAALGDVVTGILGVTSRLGDLTREEASAAISQPAALCNIRVEEGLVEAMLNDLSPANVLPAHLQIVCDRVLREAGSERVLSLEIYRRLGSASGILAGHLEHALCEMPKGLDEAAKRVLTALVSSEQTKILLRALALGARYSTTKRFQHSDRPLQVRRCRRFHRHWHVYD